MGNILIHHGIKGQRWGVRRYQNEDGSLTPSGKRRDMVNKTKTNYKTVLGGVLATSAIAGLYLNATKANHPMSFRRGEAAVAGILSVAGGLSAATIINKYNKKRVVGDV